MLSEFLETDTAVENVVFAFLKACLHCVSLNLFSLLPVCVQGLMAGFGSTLTCCLCK